VFFEHQRNPVANRMVDFPQELGRVRGALDQDPGRRDRHQGMTSPIGMPTFAIAYLRRSRALAERCLSVSISTQFPFRALEPAVERPCSPLILLGEQRGSYAPASYLGAINPSVTHGYF
jgi:hypothetical protein